MPTTPRRAAIYARISRDIEGTSAGVERQRADCNALAEPLGWAVAQEYVDNDISASQYSTKPRPGYEQMLTDIQDGHVDGVIVYNMDRLVRRRAGPLRPEKSAGTCSGLRRGTHPRPFRVTLLFQVKSRYAPSPEPPA